MEFRHRIELNIVMVMRMEFRHRLELNIVLIMRMHTMTETPRVSSTNSVAAANNCRARRRTTGRQVRHS